MPKKLEDQLNDLPWPPKVRLGDPNSDEGASEEIQLTELDVNWVFCQLLGMRWSDAAGVADQLERKFLYNKAMELAQGQVDQEKELQAEKGRMEDKIDDQLKNIAATMRPPQL